MPIRHWLIQPVCGRSLRSLRASLLRRHQLRRIVQRHSVAFPFLNPPCLTRQSSGRRAGAADFCVRCARERFSWDAKKVYPVFHSRGNAPLAYLLQKPNCPANSEYHLPALGDNVKLVRQWAVAYQQPSFLLAALPQSPALQNLSRCW